MLLTEVLRWRERASFPRLRELREEYLLAAVRLGRTSRVNTRSDAHAHRDTADMRIQSARRVRPSGPGPSGVSGARRTDKMARAGRSVDGREFWQVLAKKQGQGSQADGMRQAGNLRGVAHCASAGTGTLRAVWFLGAVRAGLAARLLSTILLDIIGLNRSLRMLRAMAGACQLPSYYGLNCQPRCDGRADVRVGDEERRQTHARDRT